MTTFTSGFSCLIWSSALRPSIPGMRRSSRTRSGENRRTSGRTWLPLDASPTTSKSSVSASARRIPSRIRRWSSAITTRTAFTYRPGRPVALALPARAVGRGTVGALRSPALHGRRDGRRATRNAREREATSEELEPLAHAGEPQPVAVPARARRGGVAAPAVVLHAQTDRLVELEELDSDLRRVRVAGDVGERLAQHPLQRDALRVGQIGRASCRERV